MLWWKWRLRAKVPAPGFEGIGGAKVKPTRHALRTRGAAVAISSALLVAAFPADASAIDWPWKKKEVPHELTAQCSVEPEEIGQGATGRLRAAVKAVDTHEHPVAIVWSGNGGVLSGTGEKVEVDASQMNPGVYSVMAFVQDAQRVSATCVANYRVVRDEANVLTMSCRPEQDTVEVGTPVRLLAKATDEMGQSLRYLWFTNGGAIRGQGETVELETANLRPGVYTVTGRVEDGLGGASDCMLTVRVEPPPPPPEPPPPTPEPSNVAQIVFDRNLAELTVAGLDKLAQLLERLQTEPDARISVEGYADPDERQPQSLAAARAGAVLRYFLERGIDQSRVATIVGLGGRRAGQLRNRTLDIIWVPDGALY